MIMLIENVMSGSETTSEWNWKMIRDEEAGRRGIKSLSLWTYLGT